MKPPSPCAVTLALDEAEPLPDVHRFSHAAMATVFEVHCVHADPNYARQAAQSAFGLLDRLEMDLSRFIANSDISRVNQLAAGEGARVSPWTMECLTLARGLFVETGKAFDASIGSGLESLDLDADGLTVYARADGVALDLGGIGKGYAVDRMAELLEDWGVEQALVHGGFSSVLALDSPPGRGGWCLSLSAPCAEGGPVLARLCAARRAFSASGTRKGDHILDPRTGRPVRDRLAAWVAVPGETESAADPGQDDVAWSPAAVADALSTAFMILPAEEIAALCGRWPGVEAWLIERPAEGESAAAGLIHVASWAPRGT
jgi:FAD:protein FMN transferase